MTKTFDKAYINGLLGSAETYTLEFKQAKWVIGKPKPQRSEDISKAISAIANASGGELILGIEEVGGVATNITPINEQDFSKEQFQQIIDHNINPNIDGLVVHRIEWDKSKNEVVYVVEIPRSSIAHQAKDLKYYQRRGGATTEAMTHSEIMDVMGRGQHPKIELEFEIELSTKIETSGLPYSVTDMLGRKMAGPEEHEVKVAELIVRARNIGNVFANYVNVWITIPTFLLYSTLDQEEKDEILIKHQNSAWEVDQNHLTEFYRENTERDIVDFKGDFYRIPIYGPSRFVPILPSLAHTWEIDIDADIADFKLTEEEITWQVHCDNAGVTKRSIKVKDIPKIDKRSREAK